MAMTCNKCLIVFSKCPCCGASMRRFRSKLTKQDVREIYTSDEPKAQLAAATGLTVQTIWLIQTGRLHRVWTVDIKDKKPRGNIARLLTDPEAKQMSRLEAIRAKRMS